MKKTIIVIVAIFIFLTTCAVGELSVLARYKGLFTEEALQAAAEAKMPEDLAGALTRLEKELFEMGFAAGYDAMRQKSLEAVPQTYILNNQNHRLSRWYAPCLQGKDTSSA